MAQISKTSTTKLAKQQGHQECWKWFGKVDTSTWTAKTKWHRLWTVKSVLWSWVKESDQKRWDQNGYLWHEMSKKDFGVFYIEHEKHFLSMTKTLCLLTKSTNCSKRAQVEGTEVATQYRSNSKTFCIHSACAEIRKHFGKGKVFVFYHYSALLVFTTKYLNIFFQL